MRNRLRAHTSQYPCSDTALLGLPEQASVAFLFGFFRRDYGAAMYTIQALWTAAHHKVPVTWVICNNRSYRILKLNMLQYLGEAAAGRRFVAMDLTEPDLDFARIAASLGVQGERVEHPDQLAPALRRAFAAGVPALVDVVIDGTVP